LRSRRARLSCRVAAEGFLILLKQGQRDEKQIAEQARLRSQLWYPGTLFYKPERLRKRKSEKGENGYPKHRNRFLERPQIKKKRNS